MKSLRRRLLAAPPLPRRGDHVEAWLKAQRDRHVDAYGPPSPEWYALDRALNDYGYRADTGTALDQPLGDVPW